jgi:hypothetical protein
MQLNFSIPQVVVKLQVFDNDVEIASARGKGVATLHAVSLLQNTEEAGAAGAANQVAAAGVVAAQGSAQGSKKDEKGANDKKDKDSAAAAEKKEKEVAAREIAALPALVCHEKMLMDPKKAF